MSNSTRTTASMAMVVAGFLLALFLAGATVDSVETSVIVQAQDAAAAAAAVREVGGEVTHELGIIRAVAAKVGPRQIAELERSAGLRLYGNRRTRLAGNGNGNGGNGGNGGDTNPGTAPYSEIPRLLGADLLHAIGIDGWGMGLAVLDSGLWGGSGTFNWYNGLSRILARYDALQDRVIKKKDTQDDSYGHGTHVASVALSGVEVAGLYNGMAPGAELIVIKAFDDFGMGTYADVIRGIDWAVSERNRYGIRVLNLSFSAPAVSHYWDDPLNQAVMEAWRSGIVVVASAGNNGPEPMTIGVPGNVPYVVTVGAMSDSYTPGDGTDDRLASFSSAGPTAEGFVKPEVTAPGGHVVGVMQNSSELAVIHPEEHDGDKHFTMSGTSQSSAVVSGIVAMMLQWAPWMEPDLVKCRLMATARPAVDETGQLAYSIFQQGAGLVNAWDAVHSQEWDCANQGLDVDADLAGNAHFGGRANIDQNGDFYIQDSDAGHVWSGGYLWGDGYLWGTGYLWGDGYLWGNGSVWGDGYLWGTSFPWWDEQPVWSAGLVESASVNGWVEQE